MQSHVVIIGLGGLGSPAALYLAGSGIGKLTLCDDDKVDLSNLQRQIAHSTSSIGQSKVESARRAIAELNPDIDCHTIATRLSEEALSDLFTSADAVLDCSDNFPTRYAINRACHARSVPLISGAAILFSGQASVFDFRQENSPCYHCLFPEDAEADELRCATTGIFSPLTGIIGTIQAAETLKLLANINTGLHGKLLTVDTLEMNIRHSALQKDPDCPVCMRK